VFVEQFVSHWGVPHITPEHHHIRWIFCSVMFCTSIRHHL
jgi:desulfoferrodoxin (superoxide reductase-like protein)